MTYAFVVVTSGGCVGTTEPPLICKLMVLSGASNLTHCPGVDIGAPVLKSYQVSFGKYAFTDVAPWQTTKHKLH